MMKPFVFVALTAVLVSGCGGRAPVDPNIALCPAKTIAVIQTNQHALGEIVPGKTSADALKGLNGVARTATLEKSGESLPVIFYQTGLPKCPWMSGVETLTPVVVKDGVIVAKGAQMVADMTHSGWTIREAAWPWQRYEFGYLPSK